MVLEEIVLPLVKWYRDNKRILPWRDKDEDDLQWARRCARAASRSLGKKTIIGLKR